MFKLFITSFLTYTFAFALQVQIVSSVTKDMRLKGARVSFKTDTKVYRTSKTTRTGKVKSSAKDSDETIISITKEGYAPLVSHCPCNKKVYALSPVIENIDAYRVVLTWGKKPYDLDAHLSFGKSHVYYNNKEENQTQSDLDDTSSFGPETLTITKKLMGTRYIYAVQDYSHDDKPHSNYLSNAQAQVSLYAGKTLLYTYVSQGNQEGNLWIVFGMDEDGSVYDINSFSSASGGPKGVNKVLQKLLSAKTFDTSKAPNASNKPKARKLLDKAEKLILNKDFDSAALLLHESIRLYPLYTKAYSKLAVCYSHTSRQAEALWASKKALLLAKGKKADRIKAKSYYKVATIYEENGDYNDAHTFYQKALDFREHSLYEKGLERMNDKLGL